MAGSLSGIGQQQIPLSQPFQPGGTEQNRAVREQDQQQRGNDVQVRGAPAARSENTETSKENRSFSSDSASNQNSSDAVSQRRGSLVNVLV